MTVTLTSTTWPHLEALAGLCQAVNGLKATEVNGLKATVTVT
jgi:hypothetical protein